MQPALLFLLLLPPPPAGALGFARCDGARTWSAANRREAAVVQGIVGNVMLPDERAHAFARPVEQRAYLDQPMMWVDGGKGDAGALVRLIGAQARDPCGGTCEGPLEGLYLAYRTARA